MINHTSARRRPAHTRLDCEALEDRTAFSVTVPTHGPPLPFESAGPAAPGTERALLGGRWRTVAAGEWLAQFPAGRADQTQQLRAWVTAVVPGATVVRHLGADGLFLLKAPDGVTGDHLTAAFRAAGRPARVTPNLAELTVSSTRPNDPRFGEMWGLDNAGQPVGGTAGTPDTDVDAPEAWDRTTGNPGVVVGVVDSGADYTHPDLYLNIWINQAEIPAAVRANLTDTDADGRITFYDLNRPVNVGPGRAVDLNGTGYIDGGDLNRPAAAGGWQDGVDADGNGYADDLNGLDARDNDTVPQDDVGHGTHVAGTIGAVGDNGAGVTGVNWRVSILPIRFLTNFGGDLADAIEGINYLTALKARGENIVASNHSWGSLGPIDDPFLEPLRAAIAAHTAAGTLFVAAAGNDGFDNDSPFTTVPASLQLDGIVAVAAADNRDALAGFSNYGATTVDLAAPGVGVLSTVPRSFDPSGYAFASGTSMAAPHVTGAAALLKAARPDLTVEQVKRLLMLSADPVAALGGRAVTAGRLNVAAAFALADRLDDPAGLTAVSVSPAHGGRYGAATRPTTARVAFNNRIDPASLDPADLLIDGAPAAGVTLADPYTAVFTLPELAGGAHAVTLLAESVRDEFGSLLAGGATRSFTVDLTAPRVVGVDLLPGEVRPTGVLTVRVTFDEPMSSGPLAWPFNAPVTGESFGIDVRRAAGSLDATGRVLTLQFTNLAEDNYRLTLFSGVGFDLVHGFSDAAGNGLDGEAIGLPIPPGRSGDGVPGGNFELSFSLDAPASTFSTQPFPRPPVRPPPDGGHLYEASASRHVFSPADRDDVTVVVNAGQTIALRLLPAFGMTPTVTLKAPDGTVLATGTTGIPPTRAPVTGAYTITLGAAAGSGRVSVEMLVNAGFEQEPGETANDSPAAAEPLAPAGLTLATDLASAWRSAVVGVTSTNPLGPDGGGYTVREAALGFRDISATGQRLTLSDPDDGWQELDLTAAGFRFNFYGTEYTRLYVSADGMVTLGAPPDGGPFFDLASSPSAATVAPFLTDLRQAVEDAGIFWQLDGTRLTIQWHKFDADSPFGPPPAGELTFQLTLDAADGSVRFDYADLDTAFGPTSGTAGVKDAGPQGDRRLVIPFSFPPLVATGRAIEIGTTLGVRAYADYYDLGQLAAGDTVTLLLNGADMFSGSTPLRLELRDAADRVLAVGVAAADLAWVIRDFVGPADGRYYARVSGGNSTEYNLVALRGAAFDLEPNNSRATAQPLGTSSGVLGHLRETAVVVPGANRDERGATTLSVPFNLPGDFNTPRTSARFQQLYSARSFPRGGRIDQIRFRLDEIDGVPFAATGLDVTIRLAYARTSVAAGTVSATFADNIEPGTAVTVFDGVLTLSGTEPGVFDVVLDVADLFQFDPALGKDLVLDITVRNAPATGNLDATAFAFGEPQTMAYVVGDTADAAGGAFVLSGGLVTGFVFDTTPPDEDWYAVTVDPAEPVVRLETNTPFGGPGIGASRVNVRLELYDAAGRLVATGTAYPDGRNEFLQFKAPAGGTYYVRVVNQGADSGDYFLGVTHLRALTPVMAIDDSDLLHLTQGRWSRSVGPAGWRGDYEVAPAGSGARATYLLPVRPGSEYELFTTWVNLPGNATNAEYRVYDGVRLLGVVRIDQTKLPGTAGYDGRTWQRLGTWTVRSGVVRVVLSSAGADGTVVADGVLAVRAGGPAGGGEAGRNPLFAGAGDDEAVIGFDPPTPGIPSPVLPAGPGVVSGGIGEGVLVGIDDSGPALGSGKGRLVVRPEIAALIGGDGDDLPDGSMRLRPTSDSGHRVLNVLSPAGTDVSGPNDTGSRVVATFGPDAGRAGPWGGGTDWFWSDDRLDGLDLTPIDVRD